MGRAEVEKRMFLENILRENVMSEEADLVVQNFKEETAYKRTYKSDLLEEILEH